MESLDSKGRLACHIESILLSEITGMSAAGLWGIWLALLQLTEINKGRHAAVYTAAAALVLSCSASLVSTTCASQQQVHCQGMKVTPLWHRRVLWGCVSLPFTGESSGKHCLLLLFKCSADVFLIIEEDLSTCPHVNWGFFSPFFCCWESQPHWWLQKAVPAWNTNLSLVTWPWFNPVNAAVRKCVLIGVLIKTQAVLLRRLIPINHDELQLFMINCDWSRLVIIANKHAV